jgi:hypothetical protein
VAQKKIAHAIDWHGLGGQEQRMLVRPQFADPKDPRNAVPVGGAPGEYRVVFTFARPGYTPVAEREFSADPDLPGDSHLAILPPATQPLKDNPGATQIRVRSKSDTDAMMFDGYPNPAGFLGRMVTTINATDFKDAEVRTYQALNPTLSNISAHLDVPFWIWRAHVTEVATGAVEITVNNPFPNVPFALRATGNLSKEFRAFVSLYREGLSSNSAAYAYLCFFKIAEGIRERRQRLDKEAVARGEKPGRAVERIPSTPEQFSQWLDAIFPVRPSVWDEGTLESVFPKQCHGRKINELLDKELVDLRNDIGHALSHESGEPALIVDDALHSYRIHTWLALMRCIARRMMKNEFPNEFLGYLTEQGKITE